MADDALLTTTALKGVGAGVASRSVGRSHTASFTSLMRRASSAAYISPPSSVSSSSSTPPGTTDRSSKPGSRGSTGSNNAPVPGSALGTSRGPSKRRTSSNNSMGPPKKSSSSSAKRSSSNRSNPSKSPALVPPPSSVASGTTHQATNVFFTPGSKLPAPTPQQTTTAQPASPKPPGSSTPGAPLTRPDMKKPSSLASLGGTIASSIRGLFTDPRSHAMREAETDWIASLKASNANPETIRTGVLSMASDPTRVLGGDLRKFTSEFRASLKVSSSRAESVKSLLAFINTNTADITRVFASELPRKIHHSTVRAAVEEALFEQLSDDILALYSKEQAAAETALTDAVAALTKMGLSAFGFERVTPAVEKAALVGVERAKSLTLSVAPAAQVQAIVDMFIAITEAFHKASGTKKGAKAPPQAGTPRVSEDGSETVYDLSTDELIVISSWVLVQASIPNLAARVRLIEDFLTDQQAAAEEGYALITTLASLHYITNHPYALSKTGKKKAGKSASRRSNG